MYALRTYHSDMTFDAFVDWAREYLFIALGQGEFNAAIQYVLARATECEAFNNPPKLEDTAVINLHDALKVIYKWAEPKAKKSHNLPCVEWACTFGPIARKALEDFEIK